MISCSTNDETIYEEQVTTDLKGKLNSIEQVAYTWYQSGDQMIPYKSITKDSYFYNANGFIKEIRTIKYSIDSTKNSIISPDTITYLREYRYENEKIKEHQTYRQGNSISIEFFKYTGDLITEKIESSNYSSYNYKYTYNSTNDLIKEEKYLHPYPLSMTITEFTNTNGVITHEKQTKGNNPYSIDYFYDDKHNPIYDILPTSYLKILRESKNNRINKYKYISKIIYNSENYPSQRIDSVENNNIIETNYHYYK